MQISPGGSGSPSKADEEAEAVTKVAEYDAFGLVVGGRCMKSWHGGMESKAVELDVGLANPLSSAVKLNESVWDAAFFIGHASVGPAGSVVLSVLLALSLLSQLVFTIITYNISGPVFTQQYVEGLATWRRNIGHNVRYHDPLTFTSLAERVCKQDFSLYPVEMSSGFSNLVSDMQMYLPKQGFMGQVASGPTLCGVALLVWSLTVMQEFVSTANMARALYYLPQGSRTRVVQSGDSVELATMAPSRRGFALTLLMVRFLSCSVLWIFGSGFLIFYSIDPADLILNAVALEIVLRIDEAIFTLLPLRIKNLVGSLKELPGAPKTAERSGVDLLPVAFFLVLVGWMTACTFGAIIPQMDGIMLANTTLCDGHLDWVYSLDSASFMYYSKSNPLGAPAELLAKAPFVDAINETIWGRAPGEKPMFFQFYGQGVGSVAAVNTWDHVENSDAIQNIFGFECADVLSDAIPGPPRYINKALPILKEWGRIPEARHVDTCADIDVAAMCQQVVVKLMCPHTCGCDDPDGPLLLTTARDFCPSMCMTGETWRRRADQLDCRDSSAGELAKWATEFETKMSEALRDYSEIETFLCAGENCGKLFDLGCGIIDHWRAASVVFDGKVRDPCLGNWLGAALTTRPLSLVCPETCGCHNGTSPEGAECPGQCNATR